MNNRQLKTKPGPWYSAEQYVPAMPGLYQVKLKGLRKYGWVWFNGQGFCLPVLSRDFAILYGSRMHCKSSRFEFRGLVKDGHEH